MDRREDPRSSVVVVGGGGAFVLQSPSITLQGMLSFSNSDLNLEWEMDAFPADSASCGVLGLDFLAD